MFFLYKKLSTIGLSGYRPLHCPAIAEVTWTIGSRCHPISPVLGRLDSLISHYFTGYSAAMCRPLGG